MARTKRTTRDPRIAALMQQKTLAAFDLRAVEVGAQAQVLATAKKLIPQRILYRPPQWQTVQSYRWLMSFRRSHNSCGRISKSKSSNSSNSKLLSNSSWSKSSNRTSSFGAARATGAETTRGARGAPTSGHGATEEESDKIEALQIFCKESMEKKKKRS
ncbi:hypothetical protein O6H91_09G001900 [Diphasiastrum complanatum]|uniref:Uncharacterized protein n=1 Tax=Diphasiastrum complanatum TaxID=34168 RepID=A0ACC2CKU4_DIPCM|nr:hypothetical protein O6H91_09G001900 [Diphasiastrum complanatum]